MIVKVIEREKWLHTTTKEDKSLALNPDLDNQVFIFISLTRCSWNLSHRIFKLTSIHFVCVFYIFYLKIVFPIRIQSKAPIFIGQNSKNIHKINAQSWFSGSSHKSSKIAIFVLKSSFFFFYQNLDYEFIWSPKPGKLRALWHCRSYWGKFFCK